MGESGQLIADGYFVVNNIDCIEELIELTDELGPIVSLNGGITSNLRPAESEKTTSRSFSYHYGLGEFPLHTDTSFWKQPARYVIFYAESISDTCTTILDARSTQKIFSKYLCDSPIFLAKTECGPIYESPWISKVHGYVRYDPCYMRPKNAAASALAADLVNCGRSDIFRKTWEKGHALVVDNWRCLHGRGSHTSGMPRNLVRLYRSEKQ